MIWIIVGLVLVICGAYPILGCAIWDIPVSDTPQTPKEVMMGVAIVISLIFALFSGMALVGKGIKQTRQKYRRKGES